MSTAFSQMHQSMQRQERGVLAIVVRIDGHAPRRPGAKLWLSETGQLMGSIGGGRVEAEVLAEAQKMLAKYEPPKVLRYRLAAELGMCCGGAMEIYVEVIEPQPRLWIFGAGHVGRATALLAKTSGFQVVMVDERPDWNDASVLGPDIAQHIVPHNDVLSTQTIESTDYILITTHNHDFDQEILHAIATRPHAWLGMIGAKRKAERAFARLRADGISEEVIASICSPVGIEIGAETPEEIAVSIVAELIAFRRGKLSAARALGVPKSG